jgi:hypothetical protein
MTSIRVAEYTGQVPGRSSGGGWRIEVAQQRQAARTPPGPWEQRTPIRSFSSAQTVGGGS